MLNVSRLFLGSTRLGTLRSCSCGRIRLPSCSTRSNAYRMRSVCSCSPFCGLLAVCCSSSSCSANSQQWKQLAAIPWTTIPYWHTPGIRTHCCKRSDQKSIHSSHCRIWFWNICSPWLFLYELHFAIAGKVHTSRLFRVECLWANQRGLGTHIHSDIGFRATIKSWLKASSSYLFIYGAIWYTKIKLLKRIMKLSIPPQKSIILVGDFAYLLTMGLTKAKQFSEKLIILPQEATCGSLWTKPHGRSTSTNGWLSTSSL